MSGKKFILEHGEPKEVGLMEWADWFQTANRVVSQDTVGEIMVSTVFLGLDHQWGDGPPLLFETMFFGVGSDSLPQEIRDFQMRYSTVDEALDGHIAALQRIEAYVLQGH